MGKVIINNNSYFKMEKGFCKIPNFFYEICFEMGLTRVQRDIYACLIRFQNGSNRNPFPSYKTLKKYTMVQKNSTIADGIRGLEEKGLIEVISRGQTQGQSNIYKVNYVYYEDDDEMPQKAPQKAMKTLGNKTEPNRNAPARVGKIPFKRGVHAEVVTSKEAEELAEASKGYIDIDYSSFDLI